MVSHRFISLLTPQDCWPPQGLTIDGDLGVAMYCDWQLYSLFRLGNFVIRVILVAVCAATTMPHRPSLGQDLAAETTSQADAEFFETRVRPLLHEHCLDCHSAENESTEGGLSLDSAQGWQRGGGRGPAVVPHDPSNSLLWKAISSAEGQLQMPPGQPLSDTQIEDLKRWIAAGAYDPRQGQDRIAALTIEEAKQWWAIQPIPAMSELHGDLKNSQEFLETGTASSLVDTYVAVACKQVGVEPLGNADRRTLIRRVTYDLTGLPPTASEIEQFLTDDKPDAFQRLIDRLLASPRYGQRYGRLWLDLMRYADYLNLQVGDNRQGSVVEYYEAWKYRDWVIAALNADMPYDQFLHHQIAGDTYPRDPDGTPNLDGLVATTWYALGPWDNGDADKHKIVSDIVDDQINVIGQSMLGVTLACARCHDHKFDPVTTEDYYALAGMFYSSRILHSLGAKGAHTEVLRTPVATPEFLAKRSEQLKQITELEKQLKSLEQTVPPANESPVAQSDSGDAAGSQKTQLESQLSVLRSGLLPEPPLTMAIQEGGTPSSLFTGIQDVPIHRRGKYTELGPTVPRGLPAFLAGDQQREVVSGSGRSELADWIASPKNPLTARVIANRLWQWHFGEGLVNTPNNFGHLGSAPSHPQLLDYLARRLIDSGWSLKELHREILLTDCYQRDCLRADSNLSEQERQQLLTADTERRWLSRFYPRRLDAQELRDSLLFATGQLCERSGGPADDSFASSRRSVYLQSPRYQREYFTALFDAADNEQPTPQRTTSTVAPQALFFLNHPWLQQLSGQLVADVRKKTNDGMQQVELLYAALFGRLPVEAERQIVQQWLAESSWPSEDLKMLEFCQILLSSNEFIYVE